MQFGISTYDEKTKTWTPVSTTYDADRHMVIALIQHFSWWNPYTWDWGALARAIQQGFGQLWGERAAPPHCSGPVPSWVGAINFLTVQNDTPVRACAQTSAQWPGVLESSGVGMTAARLRVAHAMRSWISSWGRMNCTCPRSVARQLGS